MIIAGVDEVGRGCLAGPVFSAAVILTSASLICLSNSNFNDEGSIIING